MSFGLRVTAALLRPSVGVRAIAGVAGLALLALLAAISVACVHHEPTRPDVVLISIDGLRWEDLSTDGGSVSAPKLAALETASARFLNVATLAPGGVPAAASLLTGEPPARHGLRRLGQGVLAPDVATLADRLGSKGWKTGAFLQASDISISMQLDRGFEAWDAPVESFPSGHPGIATRRALPETVMAGLQWLRVLEVQEPVFLWFHLAEPAAPGADTASRAPRLGELDRFIGSVRDRLHQRGVARGRAPIIVLAILRGERDLATAMEDAYLLREPALRVRALVEAEGDLAPAKIKGLAGLDEIAPLIMALVTGGESRMLDLARGTAAPREFVVAETLVPLTVLDAAPVKVGVRETMMAASTEPDIVQSVAADPTWPAGAGRMAASDASATFLAIDSAWQDLQRGDLAEATAGFASLAGERFNTAPHGARVGLALALLSAGDAAAAAREFERLESESAAGELAWEQALLGQATALRASGDPVGARRILLRLVDSAPRDVRALSWLASAAAEAGDRRAAVHALLRVLEVDPDHPDALESVARMYAQLGEYARAAESFDEALRRRPTSASLLALAARAHLASGDGWTALDRVERRVNIFGASVETDLLIADVYEAAQRTDLTAEFLKRALEKAPADPAIILRSAQIQLRRGDEADARGLLARARELNPESAEPCLLMARWLVSAGRRPEASAAASECAAQHPASAEATNLAQELATP